ncbi:MAG: hypothetical protein HZB55_24340 [Deltaproteobacteria bacterium]|nr:hypothetical protein [Deltaproteobacteria bacterium]
MTRAFRTPQTALAVIMLCGLISCAHVEPIPDRAMEFEEGIRVLASNLAQQMEGSGVGTLVNKVLIDPLTKPSKKIVIDPFIDLESGYPLKISTKISEIISKELSGKFVVLGELEPETLQAAQYIMNGMVTVYDKQKNIYKVQATVFDKTSGKILASAFVRISGFDTTPKEIYKDSPVFLKGESYKHYTASVKKAPGETVDKEYFDGLAAKAMKTKGDSLYEQKDYDNSLAYYNKAAAIQQGQQLEILNGQFTNYRAQGRLAEAEEAYKNLLRISVVETGEIESKIIFGPGLKEPVESNASLYNIYVRQIANFVAAVPRCQLKIVGHCSKTGSEAYNDKLSQERALWIQKQMSAYAPQITSKSTAIGRGFHENIVGTGRDDVTDQVDRRVEFVFMDCVE